MRLGKCSECGAEIVLRTGKLGGVCSDCAYNHGWSSAKAEDPAASFDAMDIRGIQASLVKNRWVCWCFLRDGSHVGNGRTFRESLINALNNPTSERGAYGESRQNQG